MRIYLGVPTLHAKVSKDTYQHLIDRVKAKLVGWRVNSLSLAGCITLAKHVLNAVLFYTMRTGKIPISLLDEIDRVVRSFIWGHDTNSRRLHLNNWEALVKLVDNEGEAFEPSSLGQNLLPLFNRSGLSLDMSFES